MNEAQLPPGQELLPEPFLREHGAVKDMKVWDPILNEWAPATKILAPGYGPYCAPIGTMAAATTPLPWKCDCGCDGEECPSTCSSHRRFRHILPHELAALPEKPGQLMWAEIGKPETWEPMEQEAWSDLKIEYGCCWNDFAYAVPVPAPASANVPTVALGGKERCAICGDPHSAHTGSRNHNFTPIGEEVCPKCKRKMDLVCNSTGDKEFYRCWACEGDRISQPLPPAATSPTEAQLEKHREESRNHIRADGDGREECASPVAPSGGEEDREETIERNPKSWIAWKRKAQEAQGLLQRAWKWLDWIESRHSSDLRPDETPTPLRKEIEGFVASLPSTPPTPPPAEAPTTKEDAVARIQYAIGSWLVTKNGESLGRAIREALDDFARTLERELSAMRQERDVARDMVYNRSTEIENLRQMLATVTAEREALRKPRCEHCGSTRIILTGCPRCGAPQCCDTCCQITTLQAERDTALASAERKDGELIDWYEKNQHLIGRGPLCWYVADDPGRYPTLRAAIRTARLTSEGGR